MLINCVASVVNNIVQKWLYSVSLVIDDGYSSMLYCIRIMVWSVYGMARNGIA